MNLSVVTEEIVPEFVVRSQRIVKEANAEISIALMWSFIICAVHQML